MSLSRLIDITKVLVYKEWIVKYKGTALGYVWSIAHPLMLASVFYLGFKIVMKVPIKDYTLFLVVALFPWQWFVNSVSSGTWSFIGNAMLIKKTLFPKFLLPLSNIIVDFLHFIISIPVILFVLYLYDYPIFHLSWFYLFPLLFVLQMLLTFSFALLFGTLNLFYRDIDRLVTLLLTLLMYVTPIFYAMYLIPKNLQIYFYLNPLVALINMWRDTFMKGIISQEDLLVISVHIVIILTISSLVYKKYEPYFAERS